MLFISEKCLVRFNEIQDIMSANERSADRVREKEQKEGGKVVTSKGKCCQTKQEKKKKNNV